MNAGDIHPERTSAAQKSGNKNFAQCLKVDMGRRQGYRRPFILDVKDISK